MEEDKETNPEKSEKSKSRLFSWVEGNYDKTFLFILIIAFLIRLWVFSKTFNQPLWWDTGDYLATAKRWGLGLDIRDMWYYRRGFLWPLFGAIFFKLGFGEIGIRFSEVLFSTGLVAISYFLIKEMFDKRLALLTSIAMTFSWVILFFTGRALTEIPSTFFLLLSLLFFWKGYVNKKGNKYIYLFAISFALAVLTRMQYLMFAPIFLVYIFAREKFGLLRNKQLWISLAIFFLILSPHIYMYCQNYGNPITDIMGHYFGINVAGAESVTTRTASTILNYVYDLPYVLGAHSFNSGETGIARLFTLNSIYLLFIIGLLFFSVDLVFGIDKLFKNENVRGKLFIFFWIFMPLLVLGYITLWVEQRYNIPVIIFLFLISAIPMVKLDALLISKFGFTKRKSTIVVFALFILLFTYPTLNILNNSQSNLVWANNLIDAKKTSYLEIMQAGLWIKENSNPEDVIISQSYPQITYYAERSTYSPNYKETDIAGFEELINEHKPKYYMLSAIERSEDWTYDYPQSHNDTLIPVWIYPPQSQQPSVIIYEFNYT